MGVLVAAAGSMLGGLAANAIMGKPAPVGPDTSVPGITSATIQASTKSSPGIKIAQVDPAPAIDYFKKAATTSADFYKQGLSLYGTSIVSAVNSINNGFAGANAALQPQAIAGMNALNRELQFMGMAPISPTVGIINQLSTFGKIPDELRQQIKNADAIQDPKQREQARQQVVQGILAMQQQGIGSTPKPELYVAKNAPDRLYAETIGKGLPGPKSAGAYREKLASIRREEAARESASKTALSDWESSQAGIAASLANTALQNQQLTQIADNYSTLYDATYNGGQLSSSQIQQELENTPGYQFQMQQGLQAVDRAAAAKGNLMSGNTIAAEIEYGQGLANQTFQQSLANLASIATQGLPANSQIANNYVTQGQNLANLSTQIGASTANTYNAIGNQYAQSYTNAGNVFNQDALFNAQQQNQFIAQDIQNKANAKNQAVASGAGYINAQTAANQFQYGVFQGQQGGGAFQSLASGGGGGWNILPVGGSVGGPGNPQVRV